MQNFALSGNRWFDSLSQPALLADNGKIEYYNPAAKALFAQTESPLEEGCALPECLPDAVEDAVTEVTVGGSRWTVQAQKQEAGVLYLFARAASSDTRQMQQLAAQLRNRLASLSLSTEMLSSTADEFWQQRNRPWLAQQNKALAQLERLTEHLELFGQSEEELHAAYQSSILDLTRLGDDMTYLLSALVEETGHSIRFESSGKELFVCASEPLIRRLVYNLTANALQAGGDITLRLKKQGNYAVFSVSDSGTGIPNGEWGTLFDPEQRVDSLMPSGCGLGLPLCQRIAALYGGQLVVSSRKKGTVVTVTLPLMQDDRRGQLCAPSPMPDAEIQQQVMTELSCVLPAPCFSPKNL